jgi:ElaB/YqjD/DUF883 family membrane-anchored ribosome-binding protein
MADTMNRGFSNTGQQPRHAGQGGHGGHGGSTGRQEESTGVVGSVVEGAQNLASSVGSSVAGAAEQAWDTTRQVAGQVADYAETAYDSARSFMRRYPFATLGIGFGLGFLLCLALQSKRS